MNLGVIWTMNAGRQTRRDISLMLSVLARILRNRFDRQVSGLNVTRSQWAMIAVVGHNPGATQRIIADTLEISEASAGRLIDRLCADGLLERRAREDDRRARAVYLTDAARPLLDRLSIVAEQGEDQMFQGFSEAELDALKSALGRVYTNVAGGN